MNRFFTGAALTLTTILLSFSVTFGRDLLVPIGGLNTLDGLTIGQYIEAVYKWGIGIAALLAVLMLVFGGAEYVLSAGSFVESSQGKERIKSAIFGLILLLGASAVLSVISSRLTNLSLNRPAAINITYDTSAIFAVNDPSTATFNAGGINKSLSELYQGTKDGQIKQEDFSKAYDAANENLNSYFSSPQYKTRVTSALQQAKGRPPTEREVALEIEDRKTAARTTMTQGLPTLTK